MPEVFEPATDEAMKLLDPGKIASAPGDLPFSEVIIRQTAQRTQFRHDNTILPLSPLAGQPVEVWATSGEEMPLERAVLFYTTDGSRPTPSSAIIPMERAQST